MWGYLRVHRPRVVVMAPPCTAVGGWSRRNRVKSRSRWLATLRYFLLLAQLAAAVAHNQLKNHRHFIAENSWPSNLWKMAERIHVANHPRVRTATCRQCVVGLCDPAPAHSPYRKPTMFMASDEALVRRLRRPCSGNHRHQTIEGSVRTSTGVVISRGKAAQVWPRCLCELVVDGIMELQRREQPLLTFPTYATNWRTRGRPAAGEPGDYLPRVPESSSPRRRTTHARRRLPVSTRTTCRRTTYTCPGCKVPPKPRHHDEHTLVIGECKWATAEVRAAREPRSSNRPIQIGRFNRPIQWSVRWIIGRFIFGRFLGLNRPKIQTNRPIQKRTDRSPQEPTDCLFNLFLLAVISS